MPLLNHSQIIAKQKYKVELSDTNNVVYLSVFHTLSAEKEHTFFSFFTTLLIISPTISSALQLISAGKIKLSGV